MNRSNLKPIRQLFFALVLMHWAAMATAQEWPKQKPITLVSAYGPGIVDTLCRLVGQKLTESMGQVVVVENRAGAGGNVAAQHVQRSAPDGYTLLMTSVSYTINPSLYPNAGYDPYKDFAPVVLVALNPVLISVNPSVPAQNLGELIALARQKPLAYASPGIGTGPHLSMEQIKSIAKIDITHVPYQPGQAVAAVIGGQTGVIISSVALQIPQVKAGNLRPLAVTSLRRSPALPDVPTLDELGMKGFNNLDWFGLFAPAGTPPEILARLNTEINRILELPDIKEKFAQIGLDQRRNTLADFSALIREEVPKWAKAVKDSGAKVE